LKRFVQKAEGNFQA